MRHALVPVVLCSVLVCSPAVLRAQEPAPSKTRKPLVELVPTDGKLGEIHQQLLAGEWGAARKASLKQLEMLAGKDPGGAATAIVFRALADAGLGHETAALCRWRLARGLYPGLGRADLSTYGAAGTALQADSGGKPPGENAPRLEDEPRIQRPEILVPPSIDYSDEAKRLRLQGSVIVEMVLGRDGQMWRPRILKELPYGLNVMALDGLCDMRYKPATLDGEPLDVYYSLTVNFVLR